MVAQDWSTNANTATNSWSVNVTGGSARTFTYDANGNTLTDGVRSYQWDAEDRLVKVTQGTNQWEFVYNGLSQRVAEKLNGNVTRRWILDGAEIVEERAADGTTVQRRFYREGEQRLGGSDAGAYFYTRDHLGSIREVTDSTATVRARYDYDPYGQREKLSGNLSCDFGFTGHFTHQASGLVLTLYRAYDAETGRWISRDPIGENGGINLYGYVAASPVNMWDPLGLEASLVLHRDCDSRDSPGTLYIFEDGVYLGSVRANTTGYIEGTTGVRPGHYDVLPKNNYEPGDAYPEGQPSVTDPRYPDQPGKAGPTYKPTVRIHPEGPSAGCVTVPREVDPLIRDLMMRNMDRGGTTLDVYHPDGSPRARPTR